MYLSESHTTKLMFTSVPPHWLVNLISHEIQFNYIFHLILTTCVCVLCSGGSVLALSHRLTITNFTIKKINLEKRLKKFGKRSYVTGPSPNGKHMEYRLICLTILDLVCQFHCIHNTNFTNAVIKQNGFRQPCKPSEDNGKFPT